MAKKTDIAHEQSKLEGLRATESILMEQLEHCRGYRGFDKDVAMATAALGRALTGVRGEIRQMAKAERRALEAFSVDQIVEYLNSLPAAARTEIAERLTGARDGDGLL